MLTVQEIKTLIDNDASSDKKRFAKTGLRYYEADHDIKDYRIFFIDADGNLKEDTYKANIRISHPFFTELVDQCVQYMLSGKDGFVKSDLPDLQQKLDEYFNDNEDFTSELYEVITGAQSKGFEYMYAYKDENDRTAFQCADSIGVIEVRAKETADNCDYIIYYYTERISKDNKQIKRIQVWDAQNIYFYKQEGEGAIQPDNCFTPSEGGTAVNVRPHIAGKQDNGRDAYYDGFGFIPFFRLDNCKKQFSALKPIKKLIDDYDMMACGLSNNIQDTAEAIYVVKGFQGDNLDELMTNIKAKKHIGVDDEGGVDIKTIDIPVDARKTKLELDEKNIYRFGFGLNTSGLKDTSATTNIAIKSAYSLLDLKANKLQIRLQQFLRKLLKVVLEEINEQEGTDFSQSNVYFDFTREIITNAQENAQIELVEAQRKQTEITTILNLAGTIDDETKLQLICEQLDLDYEMLKDKFPKTEKDGTANAINELNAVIPE